MLEEPPQEAVGRDPAASHWLSRTRRYGPQTDSCIDGHGKSLPAQEAGSANAIGSVSGSVPMREGRWLPGCIPSGEARLMPAEVPTMREILPSLLCHGSPGRFTDQYHPHRRVNFGNPAVTRVERGFQLARQRQARAIGKG